MTDNLTVPFSEVVAASVKLVTDRKELKKAALPLGRRIARRSQAALYRANEHLWNARERMEDLLAELREKVFVKLGGET